MIATVIIRFVAILFVRQSLHHCSGQSSREEIPTRHPPQRFHTPIHISLTLQDRNPRTLYLLALHLQIR